MEPSIAQVGFTVLLSLVALALFLTITFGGMFLWLSRMARQKEASARERYPDARHIDRSASFFGQESRGNAQLRGNGTLILTPSELVFEMWVVNRVMRIPLVSVTALENPTAFAGKSRFTPLLKVSYTDDQGGADSMAWQVRDLALWMRLLGEARTPGT